MTNQKGGASTMTVETTAFHRPRFGSLLHSDPTSFFSAGAHDFSVENDFSYHHDQRPSNVDASAAGGLEESALSGNNSSPYLMSPWNQQAAAGATSPYSKSPWFLKSISPPGFPEYDDEHGFPPNGLIGSLVREEGHIYSLAVSDEYLYTGSQSKNIRVWKNLKDFAGFKSSSGLVKAIVISGDKIFTGHQDGKIRVWKFTHKNPNSYKRIGNLPTLKDYVKSSMNPKNYVEGRRRKNKVKVKHFDAVSCLSLVEAEGLLYSGSWDRTIKVWRLTDSKCLESIQAHEDAVNSIVAGLHGFVFSGSADGTMKMWRREMMVGKGKTNHVLDRILLRQENAVTALAVSHESRVVYSGSSDGLLNFWEADEKGNLCHGGVLKGHKLAVLCLATGGNLVFSGSADKNICVWKREESGIHSCLSVLTGHTGPVKCIAVEEERAEEASEEDECREDDRLRRVPTLTPSTVGGRRWIVYTGSLDNSVKVWRVSEQAPELRMLQGLVNKAISDSSPHGGNNDNRCHFQNGNYGGHVVSTLFA